MKNMRKVLSMVLALVMVLSLSVTAFATEASTATVTVKVNGTVVDSNASVTPGQSVYTYLVAQYGIRTPDDWSEFEDINGDTAMALNSLTVKGTTYTNCAVNGATTDIEGEQWGTITGYGLVSTVSSGDVITSYNFVYVGNSWVYSVTNAGTSVDVSAKYMNQYTIQAGDVVTLEYKLVVSEWSSSYPITPTYPYC